MNFKYWDKWQIALFIFAVYNLIVIINLPSLYVATLQSSQPEELLRSFARLALVNNLWALATPFILWVGWICPIAKPHFLRNLFLHFLFALTVGVFLHSSHTFCSWILGLAREDNFQANLFNSALLMRVLTGSLVHYPVIIVSQRAYLYFRESRERAELLKRAELSALQAQLHPHFFFNTLNALSALIYRSPKEADRIITRLGDLFRVLLKADKQQEILLKEEISFLEAYLKIHQTLMGERLNVVWKVEPETLELNVPNLILQPLVENSLIHGLGPLEEGGTIEIGASLENGYLVLEIKDTGSGATVKEIDSSNGIGLKNTQMRLQHLYGDQHQFIVDHPAAGGLRVVLKIPTD